MFRNNNRNLGFFLTVAAVLSIAMQADARPNVNTGHRPANNAGLLKTTAACDPAESSIDLDINNVRAKLMTGGDMWWDIGTAEARYEVPKGTKKNSLFAGSVWIGGFDAQKQLKVAAQTYRQDGNDYWPGPIANVSGQFVVDAATCSDWDRFWKVDQVVINKFREMSRTGALDQTKSSDFQAIWEWPARGNGVGGEVNDNTYSKARGRSGNELTIEARDYADFVDVGDLISSDNDPLIYNPELGDYPKILGNQYIWWVFNDRGNIKQQSNTEAIGVEVQAAAFGFSSKDNLNDATFYRYRLVNRSTNVLDSTYIATWTDADLGYAFDDFIGCDTSRGLGILYNGLPIDGNGEVNSYADKVPMVGVDFFQGPTKYEGPDTIKLKMSNFTYYNNTSSSILGNPTNGIQIYNYMTGSLRNGQRFSNDFTGPGNQSNGTGLGTPTDFVFFGDPANNNEWSECACGNPIDDRRFIHSAGPFQLKPGAVNDIIIGAVWVSDVGGCPNTSFKKIRAADDLAQELFDRKFQTINGPDAPRLVVKEMNQKLVFYLTNDAASNNFKEQYGYVDSPKYRVSVTKATRNGFADSLYKFEGYRVFQLKNSEVQPAQILNDLGEVNTDLAIEVFQSDIRNGVSQLVNWEKAIDIENCDNCYRPAVKVNGRDSGLVHSFQITADAFATGANKNLVNYKTYYFVAIAYASNNFAPFNNTAPNFTQDKPYIESNSGPGGEGSKILAVAAMPNPANGNMGTVYNSDYGSGVTIKKVMGIGNGGNDLQMNDESEAQALAGPDYQSKQPVYNPGAGPVSIKVVNPDAVQAGNWELWISKDSARVSGPGTYVPTARGFVPDSSKWTLINKDNNDVIYSERSLKTLNEQILEKYGLSVSIVQVARPGDDQPNGNGYITSSVSFQNPALAWLGGVQDAESESVQNWIRSGGNDDTSTVCDYKDNPYDTLQFYEKMLANNVFTQGTWAPYSLGSTETRGQCGFGISKASGVRALTDLHSVDIVFTNDRSKWSRCVVLETSDDAALAEGGVKKFNIRAHASWTGQTDDNGAPIYGEMPGDVTNHGLSFFPGYAIDQETGERLNIVFGENSFLVSDNGRDLIWNPSHRVVNENGEPIFGGKHYVYISNTRYDSCRTFITRLQGGVVQEVAAFTSLLWEGMPTINVGFNLLPLKDGLIPTETRLKFRVTRPYANYNPTPADTDPINGGFPLYTFSTTDLAPKKLGDVSNPYTNDKQKLLDRIHAVPNPYYAYTGYELNRFDSRIKIINLPQKATISIYSVDGALIRRLDKDNSSPFVEWDIRNAKGLPISSGMYLIHVDAVGLGETIIRWFGAMRPVDITTY
jgi:hypothetical protein